MKLNRRTWTATVLFLAACGGGEPQDTASESHAVGADSILVPTVVDSAPAPAPAAAATPVPSTPQSAAPAPTAEDSAAAARDDVSPEWKQRSRAMASYAQCMEQAKGADNTLRPRLEAACGRLPTAP